MNKTTTNTLLLHDSGLLNEGASNKDLTTEAVLTRSTLMGVLCGMLIGVVSVAFTAAADLVLLAVTFGGLIGGSWGIGHAEERLAKRDPGLSSIN
ncbi:MAG: putative membrane protein YqgA involved in biofilm formation [Candidatus Azotimanducaceae bacterium]|jgi:uncharacterized membrane protein YqgA involved in biofilm formation